MIVNLANYLLFCIFECMLNWKLLKNNDELYLSN